MASQNSTKSDPSFRIVIDSQKSRPVARFEGELRAECATAVSEQLHPLVSESGAVLVVDLSKLTWIDSSGLSHLINLVTHARLAGSRVILVQPTKYVAGVLEVTQLDQWFEIAENETDAINSAG